MIINPLEAAHYQKMQKQDSDVAHTSGLQQILLIENNPFSSQVPIVFAEP